MKRAQIEEARRRAKELLEEEERQKLEWKPPDENDFSVHAHLLRKKLKAMHEPWVRPQNMPTSLLERKS